MIFLGHILYTMMEVVPKNKGQGGISPGNQTDLAWGDNINFMGILDPLAIKQKHKH
jgi:hypothetical protein